jgi:palmitoyltransferase
VRLDHRIDEIKTVKGVIEKDIRSEYGAIMERLRTAEGVKLAVLQHDIAEVQKDITRIDEILMTMEEVASGGHPPGMVPPSTSPSATTSPDMLGFLHKFRQLNDNIDYAVTKQFKVEIDIVPDDLPRELAERRALLEHYEEIRRFSKFKDDLIFKLS